MRSSEDAGHAEHESLADELLSHLHALAVGKKLPTVVVLDDMQWVDEDSLDLVRRLWDRAREHKWPLLVVATH